MSTTGPNSVVGITYGPVTETDLLACGSMLCASFGVGNPEQSVEWLRTGGVPHVRALRHGTTPIACLLRVPMGQYFAGRSVPMVGVAGVAVPPHRRGGGVAAKLMSSFVHEAAQDGFPLAGLYASTQSLYRKVGFEQAGHRFVTRVFTDRLRIPEPAGRVVEIEAGHDAQVRRVYAAFAGCFTGLLERGPYCWGRVSLSRGDKYTGYAILDDRGGLAAYAYVHMQKRPDNSGYSDLLISDLAFTDGISARRLLRFLSDFATMCKEVVIPGGPLHPLLTLLPQQWYSCEKKDVWMLRVVDVKAALEARGFADSVRGVIDLNVEDDLIEGNRGLWQVRVSDGKCAVSRAAASQCARIDVSVRTLAALYSGLYSGTQLALLGLAKGDEASLRVADGIFACGTPWMTDMY